MAPGISNNAKTILAVVATGAALLFVAQRMMPRAAEPAPGVSTTNGATAEQSMGAFRVTDVDGRVVPLVTPDEPAIVMVNSQSCGWCKRALKDIGQIAEGRPLPRLKLLTLEGAAVGAPMLAKENIVGAQLIGPSGPGDQVLLTFRYPGTPTFVAIDRNGRVAQTMPGYPMPEVMKYWVAVMLGEQDVP